MQAKSGRRATYEYIDPTGHVFSSKRSAVKAEAESTRRALTEAKAEATRGGGVAKRKRCPTPKAAKAATSPLVATETEMGSPRREAVTAPAEGGEGGEGGESETESELRDVSETGDADPEAEEEEAEEAEEAEEREEREEAEEAGGASPWEELPALDYEVDIRLTTHLSPLTAHRSPLSPLLTAHASPLTSRHCH